MALPVSVFRRSLVGVGPLEVDGTVQDSHLQPAGHESSGELSAPNGETEYSKALWDRQIHPRPTT